MADQLTFTTDFISAEEAAKRLLLGEPVALPTETVYGLAAPITNYAAIEKIFKIKNRPFFDPLIVHVSNRQQLVGVLQNPFPPLVEKLAKAFWPGPITFVLPKHKDLSPMITSGLETVAVRMPNHSLTLEIIEQVGPVAAPSANRFGKTSPTTAAHVKAELPNVAIVDGGSADIGVESTVVGFDPNYKTIRIFRPGAITAEKLQEFAPVVVESSESSPGHLKHHYMPDKMFVVLKSKNYLSTDEYEQLTLLQQKLLKSGDSEAKPHLGWLKLPAQAELAARLFYTELRNEAQQKNTDVIIWNMANLPDNDVWAAIKDRASKAATVVF